MRKIMMLAILSIIAATFAMGAACPKQSDNLDTGFQETREAEELYDQAEKSYESGDYEAALESYRKVVSDFGGTEPARHALFRVGQIQYKKGENQEAAASFKTYTDLYRDDSELSMAHDYLVKIMESRLAETVADYALTVKSLEESNFKLEMINRELRRSVDSETIYLEIDLEADRLLVKLGTQALYEYPVVTGKGRTRLRDFSTPTGVRQVENIIKDPIWYRPDWVWHEKGEDVPEDITMDERGVPGVLGPYKVGFGDGYYVHGTRSGRIRPGKYSHGCVRMNNADLKQLVKLVEVGTPLYLY